MATETIYFTPIEVYDHWTAEQVEEARDAVEAAGDTYTEDMIAAFEYWESIKDDPSVSTEEKQRAMAACQSFNDIDANGDVVGATDYWNKVYIALQELYPKPDITHLDETVESQITPNGDVIDTVTIVSEDGKTKVRVTYVNGKRERLDAIHQNESGDSTRIKETYESDGETVKSHTERTNFADGSSTTTTTNYQNGSVESEYTSSKDADGNYQSTHKTFNQDGDVVLEVRKEGDADGNFTSETYDGDGDLRSSHEHSINEDGSTTDSVKTYAPDGSVYKETIIKHDASGAVISIEEKDGDGNTIRSWQAPSDDSGNPLSSKDPSPPPPSEPPPPPRGGDPLVLDLGGDGIITTGVDAGIHFDHDGDGFKELSGFVNSSDGLLVLDRNEDGQINDGNELFGDSTKLIDGSIAQHGFAALSEFDDQKDGKIDKNDAIFDKLRIFQDFNQNGQADEGELFSLDEKKIASLNLTYEDSTFVDEFGNIHRQLGTYLTESGEERSMTDVVFTLDMTYTATEMLDVPEDIAALPDAVGYGTTYSLHQAMVRDDSGRLKELVEDFVASNNRDERLVLTEKILYVWTGQDEWTSANFTKEIEVLDSFFGTELGTDWLRATNRFEQVKDTLVYQLMRESHLKPLFDLVYYTYEEGADTWVGHFEFAVSALADMLDLETAYGEDIAQDFIQCIRGINPYNNLNLDAFESEVNSFLSQADVENNYTSQTLGFLNSLGAGASDHDDVIRGGAQSGLLYGFDGNDTIFAEGGDDIIIGGKGDDALTGGSGNDIYRFSTGFGKDRINNFDTDAGRVDVIEFSDNITQADLVFSRQGDDLIINFINSDDELRINSHFHLDSTGGYAVNLIRFADGTTLDIGSSGFEVLNTLVNTITEDDDILHGSLESDIIDGLAGNDTIFGKGGDDTLTGSDGDDALFGEGGNDTLHGNEGNDILQGGTGDDLLFGGAGADTLQGGSGDNVLVGGTGNDHLIGGEDSDVFRYSFGDGRDTISNRNNGLSATDRLELTGGIQVEDVEIRRVYNNLLLRISDGGEVWVDNFFLNESPSLSEIRFDSGTIWSQTDILDMVRQGTDADDHLYGTGQSDVLHGLQGNDRLEGYSGDDQLHGDEGADKLYGGKGNDTLLGGSGNDQLYGDDGDDVLTGGSGVDVLHGGSGSDTYLYESGFGQDIIFNNADATGTDAIVFGASIAKEQVVAERRANNLILRIDGTEDSITVSNYFLNIDNDVSYVVDEIRFADGTNWDVAAIKQLTVRQTAGDDVIHGYAEDNTFDGLAGDDEIHGGGGNDHLTGNTGGDYLYGDAGNDTLIGNSGDDVLYGGDGDDILDGGEGDDILSGYNGNDSFIFESGFGNDKIIKNYYGNGESGTIHFGTGITASQFSVRRLNQNLILTSTTSSDSLSIENFFNYGDTRAAGTPFNFVFADGSTLDFDYLVDQSLTAISDGNDYLFGYEEDNTLSGEGGDDTLIGNGGVDTLTGGEGDDYIDGGSGNDALTGGAGNDRIYGKDGDDIITGGLGEDLLYAGNGNDSIQGDEGNDNIQGDAGNDTISGGAGNDILNAGSGDDTVTAGTGNDRLYGDTGNDILTGGEGDDYLTGGQGNDIYSYSAGFGKDTIDNYYNANNDAFDVIAFDETITPDSVKPVRRGNNLVLLVGESGDQITVNNYFYSHAQWNYIVNEIQFADGTVWDIPQVKELVLTATEGVDELHGYGTADNINGLAGNDTIFGHEGDDQLFGDEGDDILYGSDGADQLSGGIGSDTINGDADNDTLLGGAGNDYLYGGDDDDILLGNEGNDILSGGRGNDVYRFSLGDGQDTINNNDSSGGIDILELQEGITSDDVRLRRVANDLVVFVGENGDTVTVTNYFYSEGYNSNNLSMLRYFDGTTLDFEAIKAQAVVGSELDDTIAGFTSDDTIQGFGGDDSLSGLAGNDILQGGAGNDSLDGGSGNDTYIFSLGDGQDVITNYDSSVSRFDKLEFQAGIAEDDVRAQRVDNDLYLHVGLDGDRIIVDRYFEGEGYGSYALDEVRFSDGTSWDIDRVKELAMLGTASADLLNGFDVGDVIKGYAGDDMIDGAGGDDAIYGGAGNDFLTGGSGSDTYHFAQGDGQDTINNYDVSSLSHDTILFDESIDEGDVLVKRSGDDLHLVVGDGTDRIVVSNFFESEGLGRYGLDEVRFASGTSWDLEQLKKFAVLGTAEDELLLGYSTDDVMKGFGGNDTMQGLGGDDLIHGGDGADTIEGGSGADTIFGDAGNDILSGNDGNDTITAGDGDDTVDGGTGIDAIFGGLGRDTLNGGSGNDTIEGGDEVDVIYGDAGNDILHGNTGDDRIFGGLDDDTIYGDEGLDIIEGNEGYDTIYGGDGVDTIHGNQGNDTLFGDSDNDSLYGDDGNDRLDGGIGEDHMVGGTGGDTYVVDNIGDEVIELADEGYDTIETDLDITLAENVEKTVLTGNANINATGNELGNSLVGNAGNNILDGAAGSDTMSGGLGDDTYHTDSLTDTIIEMASEGVDTEIRHHDSDYLLATNVENLTLAGTVYRGNGNELNNVLTGNDAANNLWGREGDDTLYGMGGDDQLIGDIGQDHLEGGDGNDLMAGGANNDTLYGNAGNDQLDGGAGTNYLRGGAGDDMYVYRSDGGSYEIDNSDGGEDWLLFTDDLSADRLTFIKSGNNLIVRVDGDENRQVTINNWFLGTEYQLYAIQPAGASGITAETINRMFPPADAEADTISVPADSTFDGRRYGTSSDEQLIGTSGNDIIRGYQGADNLFAQGGDDWLLGGSGDDYLDGGTGNDMLHAGAGDDRYVFKAGYGEDTIDNSGGGTDWLLLVDGLTQDKLLFTQVGDDLVITVTDSTDKITVKNWFLGSDYQIDYIQPDGAYGIPAAQIENLITQDPSSAFDSIVDGTAAGEQLVGTAGTNQINGLDGADQLFGLGDDDELNGGAGNDYLDGGAGDDIQNGDAGNDQLGGDAGNDTLVGGAGDDTYVYRPGSGADIIDNQGGGTDALIFTDDITSDRLTYLKVEDNLVIRIDGDETTQITVKDWFKGAEYQLSFIQPSGVSGIPASQINDLFTTTPPPSGGDLEVPEESTFDTVLTGTTAGEQVVGTNGKDLLKGLEGDDQLFAFGGDDWLLGGDGNDYFDGGAGNDTMLGGAGNDQLGGDAGNDIMSAGAGDDVYVYRPGSGSDTIINTGGGTDWLLFTDDITSDRLSYWKSGDNLLVKIDGSNDNMVTIQDWFLGGENQVSYIQPSGAYGISAAQINTMVQDEPTPSGEILTGTSGDNQLIGGAGNDQLLGKAGNDELTGGEGADEFVFDTALDSTNNIDTITDFTPGEDKVVLDNSVFSSLVEEGTLSSVNFASNTTGVAVDDNDYIIYNTSTGGLLYDADGNGQGVATQFASLSTKPQLDENNFSIITS